MLDWLVPLGFLGVGVALLVWSRRRATGAGPVRVFGAIAAVIGFNNLLGMVFDQGALYPISLIVVGLLCIVLYRRDPQAPNAGVTHGLGWVSLATGVLSGVLAILGSTRPGPNP